MSNMQFEYDPERLIEEVKKRPGIWDFSNSDYRAKSMRHKLWAEVVNELIQTDITVSRSEMRELELQLQKKWKSIRDCFQKYVANPHRTKRPYIYSKQLQFLLKDQDLVANEPKSSDSEEEKYYKKRKEVWKSRKKMKLMSEGQTTDDDVESYNLDESVNNSNDDIDFDSPTKSSQTNKSVIDDFVFANVDSQSKGEPEDPDKMFLLSLLPHLKTIPEECRLNVKMELMQVLQNANYETVRERKVI